MTHHALPHSPVLSTGRSAPRTRVGKRILDVVAASVGILLLSPLLIAVWLLVRSTSAGGAFFRQTRLGLGARPFVIYKFRTMYVDSSDDIHRQHIRGLLAADDPRSGEQPHSYKLENDPRITRVGRLLRRTSIDELPQLFNVLLGDMSLVGPRPVLPWEAELFSGVHRRRFLVPPGITGLWQVSGRNHLSPQQCLYLDVAYVDRQSFALDMKILMKTLTVVFSGDGAS